MSTAGLHVLATQLADQRSDINFQLTRRFPLAAVFGNRLGDNIALIALHE